MPTTGRLQEDETEEDFIGFGDQESEMKTKEGDAPPTSGRKTPRATVDAKSAGPAMANLELLWQ
jgi:hypothetical protein